MKEALFYKPLQENKVHCYLCPHNCKINPDNRGICKLRKNINGKLVSENYARICSAGFDPIEKKPLYHYMPGMIIFSVGSIGCNLQCKFCQNYEISQSSIDEFNYLQEQSAEDLIRIAQSREENAGIAYTYNEPTIWYEFMLDIARMAKDVELKNIMVTNGFISEEPLLKLFDVMDAFSVDLKAFNDVFYKKLTGARLDPVLKNLKLIREAGKHLEVTNLVITDENDDEHEFREMVGWIAEELGEKTVFHISRYFPTYKLKNEPTSVKTLEKFYKIARKKLPYTYLGNVSSNPGQNTYCDKCHDEVISRHGYYVHVEKLRKNGTCKSCGNKVVEI